MYKRNIIEIPDSKGNYSFLSKEIIFIQINDKMVEFYLTSESFVIKTTLKKLEELLNEELFLRINRSTIINLKHIKMVTENGYIKVYLSNDTVHIVSDNLKTIFLEKFKR